MKLGRKPRGFNLAIPHYHAVRTMSMAQNGWVPPALKPGLDNAANLPANLGMMLNDQLGDCTCAGMGHETQLVSFDAQGVMITPPDADVLKAYEAVAGYNPATGANDDGAQEQTVLQYWQRYGLAYHGGRHKISGYAEVDVRNPDDVCEAIQEGGCAYIGFDVPSGLMDDVQNGVTVWDAKPSYGAIEGGHCVVVTGFNRYTPTAPEFNLISWGSKFSMTWAFWQQYVDEAYMLIDPMWIERTGTSPWGLTEAQIEQIAQTV